MVLASHVVWHEVDYHFKAGFVSAVHESLKFLHSVGYAHRQIRVNVVIILYGIWRTGAAFDDIWIVRTYAESRIVGLGGMFNNACIPHMR